MNSTTGDIGSRCPANRGTLSVETHCHLSDEDDSEIVPSDVNSTGRWAPGAIHFPMNRSPSGGGATTVAGRCVAAVGGGEPGGGVVGYSRFGSQVDTIGDAVATGVERCPPHPAATAAAITIPSTATTMVIFRIVSRSIPSRLTATGLNSRNISWRTFSNLLHLGRNELHKIDQQGGGTRYFGSPLCQPFRVGLGLAWNVGPGCGLSEGSVCGLEPVALESVVVPDCPPGPVNSRRRWSASIRA